MINRRNFLRGSMLSALAAGLGISRSGAFAGVPVISCFEPDLTSVSDGLLVAATWPNLKATEAAMDVLKSGGRALDAVEAGAHVPEADPGDSSVGYGGLPDRDGIVTLDACIMDELGNAGSVTFLRNFLHPVSVARKVMEHTPHVMLSGEGARKFALEQGFKEQNLLSPEAKKAWKKWKNESADPGNRKPANHDTIGILSIDKNGNMAGACSTSGMAFKLHGRVGDSPIIGAGLYVDNEIGGACATGVGELVMKTLGSFLIVELMRQGRSPQHASEEAINRIVRKYNILDKSMQVGFLAVNKRGETGAFSIFNGYSISVNSAAGNRVLPSGHAM